MKFWSGLAIAATASLLCACNGDFNISSNSDGVPLAELDYEGATPTEISLAGPDRLIVTSGDTLRIDVEGDADVVKGLRFDLDEDELEIGREGNWRQSGIATIRVTMPTPQAVTIAGSGTVEVDRLGTGSDAAMTIAGSGDAKIGKIDADELEVSVAGSGKLKGAGRVKTLDLDIAGAGDLDMRQVKVGEADISVAGSGNAVFASDGNVDASIMGSGTVEVIGNAKCTVSAMGSGELRCHARTAAETTKPAPTKVAATEDGEKADTADAE